MLFPFEGTIRENALYSRLLQCPQPLLLTHNTLPSLYLDLRENFFSYDKIFSKTLHIGPYEEEGKIILAGETMEKEIWQIEITDTLEGVLWHKHSKYSDFKLVILSPRLAKRRKKLLQIKRKAALEKNFCPLK